MVSTTRDAIGGITLQVDAAEPRECARQMKEALEALKEAIVPDNLVLNDGKTKVLGLRADKGRAPAPVRRMAAAPPEHCGVPRTRLQNI